MNSFVTKKNRNYTLLGILPSKWGIVFLLLTVQFIFVCCNNCENNDFESQKPRVIVTTDGEIDDECSMVRFLLYTSDFDVEGIITTSSQYHWKGSKLWAGEDWVNRYLDAYESVYANLTQHDDNFPTPDYLRSICFVGNVEAEGEMDSVSPGSQHIVKVLLDKTDDRPVWLQAWGGVNTIARALKTIEEEHPDQMAYVANKVRLFLIWEQDSTYQSYIRPKWGKYNILTIISDQFITYFYHWKNYLPSEQQKYLLGSWMKENILENRGALCALYPAHKGDKKGFEEGDFRSEGDSPAFLHNINTGLRSMESPDWGGWGGRYEHVRENTWLDPVHEKDYEYPDGRWYTSSAWGRSQLRKGIQNDTSLVTYLEPTWRWIEAVQNDFAARAAWCVFPFEKTNHPPVVKLSHPQDMKAKPGETITLDARGSYDPDNNSLSFHWWQYPDAGSYPGRVAIKNFSKKKASLMIPFDAQRGNSIHIICEVKDDGTPILTRYRRIIITVD